PWSGMLGTTFGGNYLSSVACLAVLEVMERENLVQQAAQLGDDVLNELKKIPALKNVRGRGLMIGFDLPDDKTSVRTDLLKKHHIFTGEAKPNVIRLLPSLAVTKSELDIFIQALKQELN